MGDVKDPLGMRDPIRCMQAVEAFLKGRKTVDSKGLISLRDLVSDLAMSLESLDVVVVEQGQADRLACRLMAIGQAFARGEATERDDDGFLKLGDTATELADQLYEYATEG